MHLKSRSLSGGFLCAVLLVVSAVTAHAGLLGFPVPRLQPWHLRVELTGDSFREDLEGIGDAEASSGRALATVALGLTSWSEVYGRIGVGEFNIDEALFSGDFGFAYGGGLRVRLFPLPFGTVGATAQYLRFTSTDPDSVGVKVEGEWEEYDLALGLATRRFGVFEFYGGGAYHHSDITLKTANSGVESTLESSTPFRLFVGVHLYPLVDDPGGNLVVVFEARFIGETPQFTLGVQYAF